MQFDDRRRFLRGLLLGAASATVAAPALAGLTKQDRYLVQMLEGLTIGDHFYGPWRLLDALPPRAGGLVLVVGQDGQQPVRVDVVRRGSPTRAPAVTRHLELFVMDGGAGKDQMDPELIEALQHLAEVLQDNEAQARLAQTLLTHQERVEQYSSFMSRAALELTPDPPRWDEPAVDLKGFD